MGNDRIQFIKDYYRLEKVDGLWVATSLGLDGMPVQIFSDHDKEAVCWKARCHWGHFNFGDEAWAFDSIFSVRG